MTHIEKPNFWNKVRSSTKQLTSSIGNISIRSEHDGDSEDSTIIHEALVNHYKVSNSRYPEWLGVPEEKQYNPPINQQLQQQKQQQHNRYNPQQSNNHSFHDQYQTQSTSNSYNNYNPHTEQQQQRRQGLRSAGSSTFKDIYNNPSPKKIIPQTAPSNNTHGINHNNSFKFEQSGNDSVNVATRTSSMRDRLKKNNYRNNFGV